MNVYGNLAEDQDAMIYDIFSQKKVGENITVIGSFKTPARYYNDTNSYCVCGFNVSRLVDGEREYNLAGTQLVVITGYFNPQDCKNEYKISGSITVYQNSKQINLENIVYLEPSSLKGIIAFLSSGQIKGIGPVTAQKIVMGYKDKKKGLIEGFGLQTLEVIKDNPLSLVKFPGISKKKAEKIHESYMKNIEFSNVLMFFSQYDVSPTRAMSIYKKFGSLTLETVRKNPYRLTIVDGIGFTTADRISRKLGITPHMSERIREGTLYVLTQATTEGHCYLTEEELIQKACSYLSIKMPLKQATAILDNTDSDRISVSVDGLKYEFSDVDFENRIRMSQEAGEGKKELPPVMIDEIGEREVKEIIEYLITITDIVCVRYNDENCLYLKSIYSHERSLAQGLLALNSSPVPQIPEHLITAHIQRFEELEGFKLEEAQKQAIVRGIKHRISILTGPAGSGKSSAIKGFLYVCNQLFEDFSMDDVAQCAPTGKAAKRMTEVTGMEAKTIHRLLEYKPPMEYGYNEECKLPQKLIVLDEASMLELILTNHLIKAIDPNGTRLVIVGDIEQLPSIGVGNILKDLIESGVIPVTRLGVIKRQAENSDIILNSKNIVEGKMVLSNPKKGQFLIANETEPSKIAERMLSCITYYLKKYTIDEVQVLCPQKKGIIGSNNMNVLIQELVNPRSSFKKEKKIGEFTIREGDRVYHNKNNYDLIKHEYDGTGYSPIKSDNGSPACGIFNGETGILKEIVEIYNEEEEETETVIVVKYDKYYILYKSEEWDQIEPAYSLTVHRYQGSQTKVIIAPVAFQNYKLLSRNLLYTLVTRAIEVVVLIGDNKAINYAIDSVLVVKRNTMLKQLLIEVCQK